MCSIDNSICLTESTDTQISWCHRCKTFSLTFNSCCASFTMSELEQFRLVLQSLEDKDYKFRMMGQWHVIVKNPKTCVGFCLTKENTRSLDNMIGEAQTLYEAFKVIYKI